MNERPQPIFVLGLQRSGTTWLANLLASHPDIAAVVAEDHNGVHESIFFSHFARAFGPWSDASARATFATAYAQSDYWILTELPQSDLDEIISCSLSYADVFKATMDRLAQAQGAQAWIEKSPHHSLMSDQIADDIPNAKFVMVLRHTESMILSRLSGFGRVPSTGLRRMADLMRASMVNTLFERSFKAKAASENYLLVRYEKLRDAVPEESAQILAFLGLRVPDTPLESAFAANTSFDKSVRPRLSALDRAVIAMARAAAAALPLSVLRKAHGAKGEARGVDWPDWCWKRSGWSP